MNVRVLHHQRLPYVGQVSIERLFAEIREHLSQEWQVGEATSPFPSKALLPRLRNLLYARRQKADVHHIVGDVHYLAFGLPGERTVLSIMDCVALNRLTGWKREVLRYFWYTGPMRRARVVTTISQATKDELRRWVGNLADKVVVIPACVRSEFAPVSKSFNLHAPLVLQVGTGWNKNVERVAEALRGTPCRMEIVGSLSDTQRSALIGSGIAFCELGRVNDEDLVDAYHRCDLMIFASVYEGFGMPILEAQAVGRPVITSNHSSMPEAAGEGALFVDPQSIESIRDAVNRVCSDEDVRSELVRKGFENIVRFRPEAVSLQYDEIYRTLIKEE